MQQQQYISAELQEIARHELGERHEWLSRDIATLREMIREEGGIKCPLDDAFLLRYLRGRKFNNHQALNSIKKYCQLIESQPQLRPYMLPSVMVDKMSELKIETAMKKRDPLGRKIYIARLGNWDSQRITVDELFCEFLIIVELIMKEAETQISGIVAIIDLKNFSWWNLRLLTPAIVRRPATLAQDCIPTRIKALHFVNSARLFPIAFALLRPFLSKKIRTRMHFHHNVDSLQKYDLPKSVLPEELGGDLPPFDNSEIVESLLSNEDYYKELQKIGYDKHLKKEIKEDINSKT